MLFSFRMMGLNGLLFLVVQRRRKMEMRRMAMKMRMKREWSHLMKKTKIFQVRRWRYISGV